MVRPYDPKADFRQDVVFKFVLPHTERRKVLNELQMYNLNAFTLFGSEESLMEVCLSARNKATPEAIRRLVELGLKAKGK